MPNILLVGFGVFVFVEEIGCFRQINKAVWKHIGILNFSTISLNEGRDLFYLRFLKFLIWSICGGNRLCSTAPINKAAVEARGNFEFLN